MGSAGWRWDIREFLGCSPAAFLDYWLSEESENERFKFNSICGYWLLVSGNRNASILATLQAQHLDSPWHVIDSSTSPTSGLPLTCQWANKESQLLLGWDFGFGSRMRNSRAVAKYFYLGTFPSSVPGTLCSSYLTNWIAICSGLVSLFWPLCYLVLLCSVFIPDSMPLIANYLSVPFHLVYFRALTVRTGSKASVSGNSSLGVRSHKMLYVYSSVVRGLLFLISQSLEGSICLLYPKLQLWG